MSGIIRWSPFPSLVMVLVLIAANAIVVPRFFGAGFLSSFFSSYTPLIIASMAMAIVMLSGGIDLSVGGNISLTLVTIVILADPSGAWQWPLPLAMLAGLGVGIVIGTLNGLVVGYLRVTPLLATLATMSIASGAALTLMPYPKGTVDFNYPLWYGGLVAGFLPAPLLFVIAVALIWWVWLRSPAGLQLYAAGKDLAKTYASGVSVQRVQFTAYAGSGLFASIAGIALLGTTGAGDPTIGSTYTLYAVAAAVVGGISLMGGSGSMAGAVFGSLFLGLAFTFVYALKLPSYYQGVTSGLIVLLGLIGASLLKKREGARS